MGSWWRHTPRGTRAVAEWITREFTMRGLTPPDCTPTALARALERERYLTIEFRPHVSDDPGVYGLLRRPVEAPHLAIILFHELAHLLFHHPATAVPCRVGHGAWGVSRDEAVAEAFAVGAIAYALRDVAVDGPGAEAPDERSASAFGQLLRRTQYRPCLGKAF